ncbi:hypothetical protein [Methylobacter luteus]|uniref:hypothetical protein n=1 Tax=Methylobacter luteus TaxID=415 RepID=UPI0004127851|nr:hypothetical protein [Methylobacter luteus]
MAAKSKASEEQWQEARKKWESNPQMSFADLSVELQLTRQAISKKAHRDGWCRGDVNADVNKKVAQKVAPKVKKTVIDALVRLVESPETPPELVVQACEKLLSIENQR